MAIGVGADPLFILSHGLFLLGHIPHLLPGDGWIVIGVACPDLFAIHDRNHGGKIPSIAVLKALVDASAARTPVDLFDHADPVNNPGFVRRYPRRSDYLCLEKGIPKIDPFLKQTLSQVMIIGLYPTFGIIVPVAYEAALGVVFVREAMIRIGIAYGKIIRIAHPDKVTPEITI